MILIITTNGYLYQQANERGNEEEISSVVCCRSPEEEVPVKKVKVEMPTSIIKHLSTNWMIQSWQALQQRPEVAINGFQKAGILEAVASVIDD